MKKLSKAFFSRSGDHSFAVNHPVIPIAVMYAFWCGSDLEMEMKLKWKLHSPVCIGRITMSVHVRCSEATVLFQKSDIWHNLQIQTWPAVYLRWSASNWTHRLWERSSKACYSLQVGNSYYRKALNLLLFSKGIGDPWEDTVDSTEHLPVSRRTYNSWCFWILSPVWKLPASGDMVLLHVENTVKL